MAEDHVSIHISAAPPVGRSAAATLARDTPSRALVVQVRHRRPLLGQAVGGGGAAQPWRQTARCAAASAISRAAAPGLIVPPLRRRRRSPNMPLQRYDGRADPRALPGRNRVAGAHGRPGRQRRCRVPEICYRKLSGGAHVPARICDADGRTPSGRGVHGARLARRRLAPAVVELLRLIAQDQRATRLKRCCGRLCRARSRRSRRNSGTRRWPFWRRRSARPWPNSAGTQPPQSSSSRASFQPPHPAGWRIC